MSGSSPSGPTGGSAPRPEGPGDTATADRRTLAIAVAVMLALVLVGVGSATVFSRSACAGLAPAPVEAGAAGGVDVITAAFPDTDVATRQAMTGALDTLSQHLGPITGVAEVTGAGALAPTDRGFAALGSVTSLLSETGSEVLARVEVEDGLVIGSGSTLYAVALVNELTGQIDATVPLDGDLEGLTCVDTALVNTPLAFLLDADDGELLLLRVSEDGSGTDLELRDPVEGRVWSPQLDLGLAPPGLQGERLTGRLGPTLAVTGHRTVGGDEHPVLTAVERDTGGIAWVADRGDLEGVLPSELAQAVEVLTVGDEVALVGLTTIPDDGQDGGGEEPGVEAGDASDASGATGRLVALDTTDGSVLWSAALDPGDEIRDVATQDGRTWAVVAGSGDTLRVEAREADGTVTQASGITGSDGRVAVLDDGRAVAVGERRLVVIAEGETFALGSDLVGRDVLARDGSVSLLFDGPDGGSIAVTFGA